MASGEGKMVYPEIGAGEALATDSQYIGLAKGKSIIDYHRNEQKIIGRAMPVSPSIRSYKAFCGTEPLAPKERQVELRNWLKKQSWEVK